MSGEQTRLQALIRWAVPDDAYADPADRTAARTVAQAALLLVATTLMGLVFNLATHNTALGYVTIVAVAVFGAIPFATRLGWPLWIPRALVAGGALLVTGLTVAFEGGLGSVAVVWLAILPPAMHAVAGRVTGWISLALVSALVVLLAVFREPIDAMVPEPGYGDSPVFFVQTVVLAGAVLLAISVLRERALARAVESAEDQERARIAAEAESRSKSIFLASVSHEIRTPLNGVLGTVELLRSTDLAPEQADHVDVIRESGEMLLSILNDVLDSAKAEAGELVLAEEPVQPVRVVDSVVRLYQARARAQGIALRHAPAADLPDGLLADPQRLRQVLLNLVGNAVKFTSEGHVEVRQRLRGGDWTIEVVDTGVGIPEDRIQAIFEPFVQADVGTSRVFGGTGLGLAISQRLVELMGGRLEVESVLDEGSVFRLVLPAIPADRMTTEQDLASMVETPDALDVLVAEDNRVNQRVIQLLLERDGHRVTVVSDGEAAVATCAARRFDVVLMDVQMPGMDGLRATRALRADPALSGLTVVALTANAFPEDRQRAAEAGMDDFLAKPVDVAALRRVLARVVSAPRLTG